jgi:hypothetical protein
MRRRVADSRKDDGAARLVHAGLGRPAHAMQERVDPHLLAAGRRADAQLDDSPDQLADDLDDLAGCEMPDAGIAQRGNLDPMLDVIADFGARALEQQMQDFTGAQAEGLAAVAEAHVEQLACRNQLVGAVGSVGKSANRRGHHL